MEVVKNIAAVIGCVLSVISLLGITTKWGRNLVSNFFAKNTQKLTDSDERQTNDIEEIKETISSLSQRFDGVEEVLRQQCRNTIKNIYYKYQKDKRIPLFERKTVDYTYEIYSKTLNGNSYVTLLYNEICKWEIDTVSYQDLYEE